MLSRVAESLYWMSRYLERAEDMARIIAVNFQASLDAPHLSEAFMWEPLITITGDHKLYKTAFDEFNATTVTHFLMAHPDNPNAIIACIERARENARGVREQISREMWEQLNRLYFLVREYDVQSVTRNPYEFFSQVRNGSHLFQGVTDATMSHGEGWYFMQAGKYMERGDKTTRILDVKYSALQASDVAEGSPIGQLQWIALLKSCSAFEPFRRVHPQLVAWRVADFLLLDPEFPRSVLFCLMQTRSALGRITDTGNRGGANAAERAIGRLCAEMEYLDIRDALVNFHSYLDELQRKMNSVGEAISQTYFDTTSTYFLLPNQFRQAQQQQQ